MTEQNALDFARGRFGANAFIWIENFLQPNQTFWLGRVADEFRPNEGSVRWGGSSWREAVLNAQDNPDGGLDSTPFYAPSLPTVLKELTC